MARHLTFISLFCASVAMAWPLIATADGDASAFQVPPTNGVAYPIWLTAGGLTPGDIVSITLTAPTGQTCPAVDIKTGATTFIVDDLTAMNVTIDPTACADVDGQWFATFQGDDGDHVSAPFLLNRAAK